MTIDDTQQPNRTRIPGVKRDRIRVPAIIDDVEDWICVQMQIPDNDEYIRMFYDLFDTWLGMWFNYQRDAVQGGARTAKIWRTARETIILENCTGDVIMSGCNPTPVGSIVMWPAAASIPDHWLICNGQALLQASYPDLYAIIGVTYGTGDLDGQFQLPDFRGRSPIGAGIQDGQTVIHSVGGGYGDDKATLAKANLPTHEHDLLVKNSSAAGTTARIMASSGAGSNATQQTEDGTNDGLEAEPFNIIHPVLGTTFIIRVENEDCTEEVIAGPPGPPGPIGPTGPAGQNGECEDCEIPPPKEQEGEIDPPPGEPGNPKRCQVAQGVVDSILDNYFVPLLEFYVEQFEDLERAPEEVIEALIKTLQGMPTAIIFPPAIIALIGTLGGALLTAYINSIGAYAAIAYLQDIIDGVNDSENRELWYCDLYNAVGSDGNIDVQVWEEFLGRVGARSGIPHDDLAVFLENNIPLYIARTEAFISTGGSFDCTTCDGVLCPEEYREWESIAAAEVEGWTGVNGSVDVTGWEGDTTEIADVTYTTARVANGRWTMTTNSGVAEGIGVRRVFDPPCMVDRIISIGTKNHTNRVRRFCAVKRASDGVWQVAMNTNNTGIVNTVFNSGGNFDPALLITEAVWLYISERSGTMVLTIASSQVNTD